MASNAEMYLIDDVIMHCCCVYASTECIRISLDNGLSNIRHSAIIYANTDFHLITAQGSDLNEQMIEVIEISLRNST